MPRILFVANTGWYLYNFRLPLARFLRGRDVEVVLVSPRDPYVARMQAEGFRWIELALDRRSVNPLRELLVVGRLARIYRQERPAAVHHFTAKCVLYGTIAAKLSGVRAVVNALTGLGHIFMGTGRKARVLRPIVRWLYRNILTARRVRVVFQNPDDLQTFTDSKLVVPDRTVLIRGSGVNLQRFSPRACRADAPPAPIVLFAARLNRDKGVCEFVEAARMLKSRGVEAIFQIAGSPDPGNPTSITAAQLEEWRREGAVDLLGHVDAIDEIIAQASLVTLPTHGGEGVPRVLLEAAAMGKPIVATDVPGCRERSSTTRTACWFRQRTLPRWPGRSRRCCAPRTFGSAWAAAAAKR
jgi:glycosyltransferase involved in cell wall biosynthesis